MSFLQKVDEYILDRIEHMCHSIQRTVGMTNFDLARYALLLYTVFGVVYSLFYVPQLLFVFLAGFVSLMLSVSLVAYTMNLQKNFVNYYRVKGRSFRIYGLLQVFSTCVTLFFVNVHGNGSVFLFVSSMFFFALFFYLLSCTPLPPGTSKLGEFFKKLKSHSVPQVQPSES